MIFIQNTNLIIPAKREPKKYNLGKGPITKRKSYLPGQPLKFKIYNRSPKRAKK